MDVEIRRVRSVIVIIVLIVVLMLLPHLVFYPAPNGSENKVLRAVNLARIQSLQDQLAFKHEELGSQCYVLKILSKELQAEATKLLAHRIVSLIPNLTEIFGSVSLILRS